MDAQRLGVLKALLATANRHVTAGQELVSRQRKTIANGRFGRRDMILATELLAQLERSLLLHIADRDRTRREYELLTAISKTDPTGRSVLARTKVLR
jgi:hypothetical protein